MPDEPRDPSGNTQQFRAFANSPEPAAVEPSAKLPLIVGVAVAIVVLVVLVGWLAIG